MRGVLFFVISIKGFDTQICELFVEEIKKNEKQPEITRCNIHLKGAKE